MARTGAFGSKVVVLDEPTAALGVKETSMVLRMIEQLRERGLAVILISHNMPNVWQVADRIHIQRLGGLRRGDHASKSHSMTDGGGDHDRGDVAAAVVAESDERAASRVPGGGASPMSHQTSVAVWISPSLVVMKVATPKCWSSPASSRPVTWARATARSPDADQLLDDEVLEPGVVGVEAHPRVAVEHLAGVDQRAGELVVQQARAGRPSGARRGSRRAGGADLRRSCTRPGSLHRRSLRALLVRTTHLVRRRHQARRVVASDAGVRR